MLKRLLWIAMLTATPLMLAGCPGESDLSEELEEGVEEVGDEIDDAL